MITSNTKRERAKISELARDYESKGFKVSIAPRGKALPPFLRQFQFLPDLIATSKGKSYVVEVSSRDTAERLRELSPIVEAIEDRQGWEFILVMTNPRNPEVMPVVDTVLELEDLQEPLAQVKSLAAISADSGHNYDHAVLLAAWAVIEAALRMYLHGYKSKKQNRSSRSLVRDAVMYGFITASEGHFLDSVAQLRNSIAHGAVTVAVSEVTLKKVLELCDSLARDLSRSDA
jgi:hypothetical protein